MVAGCGLLIGLEDRELPVDPSDATVADGAIDGASETSTNDAGRDGDASTSDVDAKVDACACDAGCNPAGQCLDEIVSLAMGRGHQCHVRGDGKLFCLGDNDFGQLGKAGGDSTTFAQVTIAGTTPLFREVSIGGRTTCAVTRDGDLYCWGKNDRFQAGNDGGTPSLPKKVDLGGLKVKTASAGSHGACAIVDIATGPNVRCWGNGTVGELGLGYNPNDGGDAVYSNSVPQTVKGLRAKSVHVVDSDSSEAGRVCAVAETDSTSYCWGLTNDNEITSAGPATCDVEGNTKRCALEPMPFDVAQTLAIGNGLYDVCALQAINGLPNRILCRGTTQNFVLASDCTVGNTGFQVTVPAAAGNALGLVSTVSHRCFTNAANELWCFGNNGNFQILRAGSDQCLPSQGGTNDRYAATPVRITLLADGGDPATAPNAGPGIPIKVKLIAVGQFNVLVYSTDKKLIGWGANQESQLGAPTTGLPQSPYCNGVGGTCQGITVIPQPAFP